MAKPLYKLRVEKSGAAIRKTAGPDFGKASIS